MEQVHRQLRIGVRTWTNCTIEDLNVTSVAAQGIAGVVNADAHYRFRGTDRDGVPVAYQACARFEVTTTLGVPRITAFEEHLTSTA